MAKEKPSRDEITLENSPISEGLRQAVENRVISKYRLAVDVGISKPQLYRFLNRDRGLSQENLDALASHLKVRITPQEETTGLSDSDDSTERPAIEQEHDAAANRSFSLDRLTKILGDLEAVVDREFSTFEAGLVGLVPVTRADEPGVVDRLKRWFQPHSRYDGGGLGMLPDGSSTTKGTQADALISRSFSGDTDPTATTSLLDELKGSVKRRLQEAIRNMTGEMRSCRVIDREAVPSQAPPAPSGAGGESDSGTSSLQAEAPPIPLDVSPSGDGIRVMNEPSVPVPDDGGEEGESVERGAPTISMRRSFDAPEITIATGGKPRALSDDQKVENDPSVPRQERDPCYDGDGKKGNVEEGNDGGPDSLSAQIAAMKERLRNLKGPLDDDDDDDIPSPQATTAAPEAKPVPAETIPNEEDDDNYFGPDVPDVTTGRESNGAFPMSGWKEKIPYAIEGVQNPGIQELAKHLMKPKGSTGRDQAKFVRFMTQLIGINPEAKKILAMPDLADRYKEIAKKVAHPEDMGRIANRLGPEELFPAGDEPAGFYGNLQRILEEQGIHNGVAKVKGVKATRSATCPAKPGTRRESRSSSARRGSGRSDGPPSTDTSGR